MKTACRSTSVAGVVLFACVSGLYAGPASGPQPDMHPEFRPGHSSVERRDHFSPGHHVDCIPSGSLSILLGGTRFFFHAGLFYQWSGGQYVIISAPFGAVVPVLPVGCSVEIVNGETYYLLNGSYYRRTSGGYIVVRKPVPTVVVVDPAPATPNAVTVWVQNPNGSRTPVELKPSGDGQWIGPKGEYYPSFPSEAQLRPVYGVPGTLDPSAMVALPQTQTLWIENMNGSKTPVVLSRLSDGTWKGPNGEIYAVLPTEADLRAAYGLQAE